MPSFPLPSDAWPRPPLDELERTFVAEPLRPVGAGLVRGTFLGPVRSRGATRLSVRALDVALFRAVRWGLDLDARRWWFESPRLAAGHFRIVEGPSRWRDTRVLQLHYDVSRLPLRGVLYDELKPLEGGRILGLGGLAFDRGEGDHFFFALAPVESAGPVSDVRADARSGPR
ncbi:MAG: hypothetical protein U0234_13815 [Sandaracinus sp.]